LKNLSYHRWQNAATYVVSLVSDALHGHLENILVRGVFLKAIQKFLLQDGLLLLIWAFCGFLGLHAVRLWSRIQDIFKC